MKSIKSEIFTIALLINITVAMVLTTFNANQLTKFVEKSNQDYLIQLSDELSTSLGSFLEYNKGYLEGQTQALLNTSDYSESFIAPFTFRVTAGNPNILYTYFNTLTDDGIFTSSDGWTPPENYSWENKDWVKLVSASDTLFIDIPSYDRVSQNIVTLLRKRVYDGQVHGILNIALNLNQLSERVNTFELPKNSYAFVIDKSGRLVTYTDSSIFIGSTSEPRITDKIPGFSLEQTEFTLKNSTYISTPINNSPWTLWIVVPTSYFQEGVFIQLFLNIQLSLGMLILSVILIYLFMGRLIKPLDQLKQITLEVADGNYTSTIDPTLLSIQNEIGQYARTFSTMMHRVLERKIELQENFIEMQALYEEMAATEETLHNNYDELEEYKNQVEFMAFHNPVTNLGNRNLLLQTLNQKFNVNDIIGTTLFCFSFKEIDHYRRTLNRPIFEQIYQHISQTVTDTFTFNKDTQLFNLSGGSFLFLLGSESVLDIEQLLKDIQHLLDTHKSIGDYTIKTTIIAGVYIVDEDALDRHYTSERIISFAEAALKKAFSINGLLPICWFDDDMYHSIQINSLLENDLYQAIDKNQLFIVIQPQYDQFKNIIGAEALVRWDHPKLGLVAPDVFIPLAESIGIIDKIDFFVAKEVMALQHVLCKSEFTKVPISINLSIIDLLDPTFLTRIENVLKDNKLSHQCIIFEITETAFASEMDVAKENMTAFIHSGFTFHLDDFGTGYSSLSYLTTFPVSTIKMDQHFTSQILSHTKASNIVLTSIEMAKYLDLDFLAEGVETLDQMTKLIELGCTKFQGYYLSRPIDIETYIQLLENKE